MILEKNMRKHSQKMPKQLTEGKQCFPMFSYFFKIPIRWERMGDLVLVEHFIFSEYTEYK